MNGKPSASQELAFMLFQELGAEMRLRADVEHLYTAAAIGAFSAVAWGVASMNTNRAASAVAAVGVVLVAAAIIFKIVTAHRKYAGALRARAQIAQQLSRMPGSRNLMPAFMFIGVSGPGYLHSAQIVAAAAAVAFIFCIVKGFW